MFDRGSFIRLTALAGVAAGSGLPTLSRADQPAQLRFDMRSNFWENLQHRLYFQAQVYESVQRGYVPDAKQGVWDALAADAYAEYRHMNPSQRSLWEASMKAYIDDGYTDKDLLDDSMAAIDAALMDVADGGTPPPASIRKGLLGALVTAAPVYRETYWSADDTANRAWISMVTPAIERYGQRFSERLRSIYQTDWPLGPFRVDVSSYSNWAGFYTNVDPVHIVASPRDMRNNSTLAVVPNSGTSSLEIVFHEASHTVVTPGYGSIGRAIENAATQLRVPEPDGLWHAVIFYTAGRVVADAVLSDTGERYMPIAEAVDVYTHGWSSYRAALVDHWQPYLDGKHDSLADALRDVVAAVSA